MILSILNATDRETKSFSVLEPEDVTIVVVQVADLRSGGGDLSRTPPTAKAANFGECTVAAAFATW